MRIVWLFTGVAVMGMCAASAGAQPAASGPSIARPADSPSPGAFESVDGTGKRAPLTPTARYGFTFEKARPGETLSDVMRRKGLSTDAHTVQAMKDLNPDVGRVETPLKVDEKIHFVAPVDGSRQDSGMVAVSPKATKLARTVFIAHDDDLVKLQADIRRPAGLSQLQPADRARFIAAVDRVANANKAFIASADTMTPRQRMLADLQITLSTTYAADARVGFSSLPAPGPGRGGGKGDLAAFETMSYSVTAPTLVVKSVPHPLRVSVKASGSPAPERMDVYVLPIGVLEYADALPLSQIQDALDMLKFPNPTSPSEYDVDSGYVYGVWIGAREAADKMAHLVQSTQVRYRKLDARRPPLAELVFDESERVPAR